MCFVEVNSYMIQEFIGHTLVSSAIVDTINKYREIKDVMGKEEEKKDEQVLTRVLSSSQIFETYSPRRSEIFKRIKVEKNDDDKLDFSIMDDYE